MLALEFKGQRKSVQYHQVTRVVGVMYGNVAIFNFYRGANSSVLTMGCALSRGRDSWVYLDIDSDLEPGASRATGDMHVIKTPLPISELVVTYGRALLVQTDSL